ncbi:hypothetical protein F6R98_07560 [Candidatus Methylospira mobilis]|uniref:Uncharacterized protein n=1 Tax=Candidatus Methylospira mobilis TaxID=1808979 RepID=A0A5Q0BK11_9GAMM|nr:hypothetical protein [Candidatus Methylospira mobilis]QFY42498.1 hypothetical protein F6R98_07560 [Candidatus Methylospira mobilis]WNV04394.1 hypothetical protein RP726_18650 [Candidatus Methylospira mobilis]
MKTLMQINNSLFSEQGRSPKLAQRFVRARQSRNTDKRLIVRDLALNHPAPHLIADLFQALITYSAFPRH